MQEPTTEIEIAHGLTLDEWIKREIESGYAQRGYAAKVESARRMLAS